MTAAKDGRKPNLTPKAEEARREREDKLAEALRQNLNRRKSQKRDQAGEPEKNED